MRVLVTAVALGVGTLQMSGAQAQGPGRGFGGPPGGTEQSLVEQFDADRNGWLSAEERKAARAFLDRQARGGFGGGFGRGGFGPFGGRGYAAASPGRSLAPRDVRNYSDSVPLYDAGTLRTLFIQFDNAEWEDELQAFYRTGIDVPATVVMDGHTYRNVGVRFRGQSSFGMVPAGSKRSLNLTFDLVVADQHVGGYRTLNLLNAANDPTFVRATLYASIARDYIPAPALNHMRVAINGESWGVFINAQQYNKDFLRDNFKTTDGARWHVPGTPGGRGGMEYWGDDPDVYKTTYEIKSKDEQQSWRDLIRLFKLIDETPVVEVESALAPVLDIDGVLRFLALEVALVNSDGYWARASDYSIYQDPQGRFHIIPHDMNEGLSEERAPGGGGRGRPGGPLPGVGRGLGRGFGFPDAGVDLDPLVGLDDSTKPLRSKLLAVPSLRAVYLGYVRDIADKWLEWQRLEVMVRSQQALIADEVKRDTRKLYTSEAFTDGVDGSGESLKAFVEARRAFLLKSTQVR